MHQAVMATYYHITSTDGSPNHTFCPIVDPEPCLEQRPVKFRRPALPPCAGATAHFAGAISRFALCFADCRVGACPPDEVTCLQCPNRSPYSPSRLVTSLLPCTAMPLVNWNEATPEDLAGFTADYLREELARRNLDTTGPKEEVINRLIADIAQNRSATPTSPDSAASIQRPDTAPPPPSSDAAQTTELLTGLLQQLLRVSQRAAVPVQVTTLPDLSASLPTYSGDDSISASHWIEELERTQNLASWQPSALLAVAMGKLRGAAADWKAVIGRQCPTWETFRQAFLDQFSAKKTLLQWQQAVTCRVQAHEENLVNYSLAKLKLISGCPVTLSDTQRIEYALQGIADSNLATTIAAQRPATVAAYMDIVTQLDQTLSHSAIPFSRPGYLNATPPTPSLQSPSRNSAYMNPQAVSDRTSRPQRISALPPDQQEFRYHTISAKHGAPAYRPGQNLAEAVCFQCRQKGHLASKCPSRATAPTSSTHSSPALHSTPSETLDGSLVQCALVTTTIAGIGQVDAFPDSGSKVTLVSRCLVSSLPLLPWTRPPLVVVGGKTVAPAGAVCLKVSVGPITALVEAAALHNNAVPLILGEDWFSASHAQLVFQPPMPTEIRHAPTGTIVRCHERLLPRMSNAVMIQGSLFNHHMPGHHSSAGLQCLPLPGPDEPPWLALSCQEDVPNNYSPSPECKQAASPIVEQKRSQSKSKLSKSRSSNSTSGSSRKPSSSSSSKAHKSSSRNKERHKDPPQEKNKSCDAKPSSAGDVEDKAEHKPPELKQLEAKITEPKLSEAKSSSSETDSRRADKSSQKHRDNTRRTRLRKAFKEQLRATSSTIVAASPFQQTAKAEVRTEEKGVFQIASAQTFGQKAPVSAKQKPPPEPSERKLRPEPLEWKLPAEPLERKPPEPLSASRTIPSRNEGSKQCHFRDQGDLVQQRGAGCEPAHRLLATPARHIRSQRRKRTDYGDTCLTLRKRARSRAERVCGARPAVVA
ncbi:hypothetical protein HPB48_005066 [Haemaphysalis longicornis]|uniref:CCHC-type domain-containing protein n=1 Tax=Haemaphysalis longicornis TaxID=44386 RepID=A0A9J6FFM4_HAELO|nr:hypothetical protein HPB48_005066 [Haemaphysalis longicornis]